MIPLYRRWSAAQPLHTKPVCSGPESLQALDVRPRERRGTRPSEGGRGARRHRRLPGGWASCRRDSDKTPRHGPLRLGTTPYRTRAETWTVQHKGTLTTACRHACRVFPIPGVAGSIPAGGTSSCLLRAILCRPRTCPELPCVTAEAALAVPALSRWTTLRGWAIEEGRTSCSSSWESWSSATGSARAHGRSTRHRGLTGLSGRRHDEVWQRMLRPRRPSSAAVISGAVEGVRGITDHRADRGLEKRGHVDLASMARLLRAGPVLHWYASPGSSVHSLASIRSSARGEQQEHGLDGD